MTEQDIIRMRDAAETGKVQFKERIYNNKSEIAEEIVAFSNSRGGTLVIGINDKSGNINALSFKETQETTNMLANIASENVFPSILIETECVPVCGGNLVVVIIKEGINKPYHDNKGVVWVKNGADKRKVFDNAELAEMMTECGTFSPDESVVPEVTVSDLDDATIKRFLSNRFAIVLQKKGMTGNNLRSASINEVASAIVNGHTIEQLLRNLGFLRPDGRLTMAAVLMFAKSTQRWLPTMTAKCISFVGNSVGGTQFRDKVSEELIEGNLLHQFDTIMSFFTRNLRNVQADDNFNSPGKLEIPYESLLEFVVNACVHRSLNIHAPIRIFIFDDRVEIHSPGTLPNGLQVEDIVAGTSMPRNRYLFDNAIHLLPYTGAGSGVQRALAQGLDVQFVNNVQLREFLIVIKRSNHQAGESNHQAGESNHQAVESNHQAVESNHQAVESNHQRGAKLTKLQEDIRNFCSVPRTSQEIMDRIGITNQNKNRQRHIGVLVEMGVLEFTIPENPKDKKQKYVRTHK
ncbi:MAG: putative DNA binding domain-containing protein [Bacteroidaceae bacterium]|nr:putative DNA binding domain-containing protein [Bacteroidaceae bacterium]